jgi:hypothetical protein
MVRRGAQSVLSAPPPLKFGILAQPRRANQFAFRFHAYAVCPALKSKIFFFRFFVNNDLLLPFRDLHKGRIAIVTNVERNAVDAKMLETCGIDADGEVVWSWRAYAGAKLATMLSHRADNGGKRWFTGESSYKP